MFLLLTRLVMGELGHAMPMESAAMAAVHTMSVAESDPAACHEQEIPTAQHVEGGEDHASHSSGEQDCCKMGDCECPCLHVPCAALDTLTLDSVTTDSLRTAHGADVVISQRPSGLFRPPA